MKCEVILITLPLKAVSVFPWLMEVFQVLTKSHEKAKETNQSFIFIYFFIQNEITKLYSAASSNSDGHATVWSRIFHHWNLSSSAVKGTADRQGLCGRTNERMYLEKYFILYLFFIFIFLCAFIEFLSNVQTLESSSFDTMSMRMIEWENICMWKGTQNDVVVRTWTMAYQERTGLNKVITNEVAS